jgi:hypothetical protein
VKEREGWSGRGRYRSVWREEKDVRRGGSGGNKSRDEDEEERVSFAASTTGRLATLREHQGGK